jgi:predicted membrane protein
MSGDSRYKVWGIILIALGIIFLFKFSFSAMLRILWPLALIGIGLYVIFKRRHNGTRGGLSSGDDKISDVPVLFGDIKIHNLAGGVGSMEKMLLFGDITIDLTGAKLNSGDNYISAMAMFGDIRIIVPDDFPAKADLACCAGDLNFRKRHTGGIFVGMKAKDDNYDNASAKLLINSKICFGDIKVTSKSK